MVGTFRQPADRLSHHCLSVFLDPKTYSYYNATMQKDDEPPRSYQGEYSTDLISEKSIHFLDQAISDHDHKPFFLAVTPIGPHSEELDHRGDFDAPLPAHRHKDWYPHLKAPRTSNFNPDVVSAPHIDYPIALGISSLIVCKSRAVEAGSKHSTG